MKTHTEDLAVAQNKRPAEHEATVARNPIRPATELPWKQGIVTAGEQADDETVNCPDGEIVADTGARALLDGIDWPVCAQNAAYIVHAANNYPKLVAAIQLLASDLSVGVPFHERMNRAIDLLRELGELA